MFYHCMFFYVYPCVDDGYRPYFYVKLLCLIQPLFILDNCFCIYIYIYISV